MDEPLLKIWKSDFYAFNKNQKNKCIRSVSLNSKNGGELKILSDIGHEKIIHLFDGFNKYNFFVFGGKFAFEFKSDSGDVEISNLDITISIGGGD